MIELEPLKVFFYFLVNLRNFVINVKCLKTFCMKVFTRIAFIVHKPPYRAKKKLDNYRYERL